MELVINTFGTTLSRDKTGFVIHHKDGKQLIPADGVTSIQLSKGAQITSDAVLLAIEHEIGIMFLDKSGKPVGRIWSPKYGSISSIRKGQINFSFSHDALAWIKNVICKKIDNQQALLLMMSSDNPFVNNSREKSINRLEDYRQKISSLEGEVVQDVAPQLRGWEGVSSKIYFETLNLFFPEEYRFESRTQNPALDIANAFLNYGYGILYGKIEAALIKAGIDPYVGVLHRDDYNRPVLVYDVIELFRVWVDYVVVNLLIQKIITDDFYSINENGSYWLENLGKRILIQSLNDYMDEVVKYGVSNRSRESQLQLYANSLAQEFKKYQDDH